MIPVLLPLLLACASDGPGAGGAASQEREPPAPDGSDPDLLDPWAAEPTWSVEEMEANVQAMIDLGFPNPRAPYLAYLELMGHGDELCPGDPTQLVGQEIGLDGCYSSGGYHYEGNTTLIETDVSDEMSAQHGFQLVGDFVIDDDQGDRLAGGGIMMLSVSESGPRRDWGSQAAGTWIHTLRDDWLGRGISATLAASGTSGSEGQDRLALQGTLGLDHVYVQLDLTWPLTECAGHATGEVQIRDPSGLWGTLVLDESCDGCGTWTMEATGDSAEVCLDFRSYGGSVAELGTW